MNLRILMTAIAMCLLIVSAACDSGGGVFDVTSVLDQTNGSADDEFLSDGLREASVLDMEKGDDDDDDDDDCPPVDPDGPDAYDDEMIPDPDCNSISD